jgi:hypothetical protein
MPPLSAAASSGGSCGAEKTQKRMVNLASRTCTASEEASGHAGTGADDSTDSLTEGVAASSSQPPIFPRNLSIRTNLKQALRPQVKWKLIKGECHVGAAG